MTEIEEAVDGVIGIAVLLIMLSVLAKSGLFGGAFQFLSFLDLSQIIEGVVLGLVCVLVISVFRSLANSF